MTVPQAPEVPEVSEAKLPRSARSAARLGSVQALYQMELRDSTADSVVAEFLKHRLGKEIDGDRYHKPDREFFENLVRGVVREQRMIDQQINGALAQGWSLKRLDSILRAILRTATYELLGRTDVPVKVIINEYVDLAKAFFNDDEPGFVNGILDRLGKEIRKDS